MGAGRQCACELGVVDGLGVVDELGVVDGLGVVDDPGLRFASGRVAMLRCTPAEWRCDGQQLPGLKLLDNRHARSPADRRNGLTPRTAQRVET